MEMFFEVSDNDFLKSICGVTDRNIKNIEKSLNVAILFKSNGFLIQGGSSEVKTAGHFVQRMQKLFQEGIVLSEEEISAIVLSADKIKGAEGHFRINVPSRKKKFVFPKTPG